MKHNIKAGYQLHIKTYEGDGDFYKTEVLSGIDLFNEVKLYIEILEQFKPKWMNGKYGNENANIIEILSFIEDIHKKYPDVKDSIFNDATEDSTNYNIEDKCQIIKDILVENFVDYNYNAECYNAVDSYKVYYIPEEIKDVTDDFKL